jgi:hypothetical protein
MFKRRRNGDQSDTQPLPFSLRTIGDYGYVRTAHQLVADSERERSEQQTDPRASRGHVIYAQVAGRYVLIERDGEPPQPDAIVELPEVDGQAVLVSRVGKSPLPNDSRPCGFAESVSPD